MKLKGVQAFIGKKIQKFFSDFKRITVNISNIENNNGLILENYLD